MVMAGRHLRDSWALLCIIHEDALQINHPNPHQLRLTISGVLSNSQIHFMIQETKLLAFAVDYVDEFRLECYLLVKST